jgi:hypothetical protein
MNRLDILDAFDTVCKIEWDRYTETEDQYTCYGWIGRRDGKKDFLVVNFGKEDELKDVWFCTSSAKYSKPFSDLLGNNDHAACKKLNTGR